jgi:predicted dienelactone hydrolase
MDGGEAPAMDAGGGPVPGEDADLSEPGEDAGVAPPGPDVGPSTDAATPADDVTVDPPPVGTPDPWVDGDFAISERQVQVPVSTGGTIAATLYVPRAEAGVRFPAVVFAHGFQLAGSNYQVHARRMASHGIIALLPSWGDSLLSARTHAQLRADMETISTWLLAQSEGTGEIAGLMIPGALGVAGHSRGGKSAVHQATGDARVRAVFLLDPVDSGPPFGSNPTDFPSVTPELMPGLTVPLGILGAGLGATGFQACAPAADNYQAYFDHSPSGTSLWVVPQGGHNAFLDSCTGFACRACTAGRDDNTLREVSRALMTAWFRVRLADDRRYEESLLRGRIAALIGAGTVTANSRP